MDAVAAYYDEIVLATLLKEPVEMYLCQLL